MRRGVPPKCPASEGPPWETPSYAMRAEDQLAATAGCQTIRQGAGGRRSAGSERPSWRRRGA
jgi:hypothetical protein